MRELEIVGVRIELPSNQPLILLKEVDGPRHLPVWIGAPEAASIATSLQGITPPRPMTHDLLASVIDAAGLVLTGVSIVAVEDAVFYARLHLSNGSEVDARTSDAVALMLRTGAPLTCEEAVLDEAGVIIGDGGQEERSEPEEAEEQVREFREFLDDIEPEDFR
ncbi:bifunctional nuclease family protein [Zhihengliuella alba]|uniref:Bifunctional nuclease family protein n=1 Tax=Zhihengliuella alba TaxID=547018 RepID=A0ABP7CJX0_9MICC